MAEQQKQYRIVDFKQCGQILANGIPDLTQAQMLLDLLNKDYPESELSIESYTKRDNQ